MSELLLAVAALPDLDRIREILKRIQELLVMGGVALAGVVSLAFLVAWVLSHLRRPSMTLSRPWLSSSAMVVSWIPVSLTFVAALGVFVLPLRPLVLKAFAIAVLVAALAWCLSVAVLVVGGSSADLARARRALLLAGTPWYCLALYLSTYL